MEPPAPHPRRALAPGLWQKALGLLGFALLVLGARWAFVDAHGVDLPYWDQWDAMGEQIFRREAEGTLGWADFLAPHNEHRPALTRLLEWSLARLNGQWDARLEMAVNAVLPTGLSLLLLVAGWPLVPARWRPGWAVLLAAGFSLPYGGENALGGFQSQFYLLALSTVGYLWLTLTAERPGPRWWLGQLCGAAALFSMAGAVVDGLAVALMLGAQTVHARRATPLRVAGIVSGLAMVVAALMLRTHVPGHDELRAAGPIEWIHAFTTLLTWPGVLLWPVSLLLVAPAIVLGVRRWRGGGLSGDEAAVLGLALWTGLQCAAAAYARGHHYLGLSNRYLDLFLVGVAAQFLALALLLRDGGGNAARRPPWTAFAAGVWLATVLAALGHQSVVQWQGYVVPRDAEGAQQVRTTRAYLATGDPAILRAAEWGAIPYPNADALIARLAAPGIPALLPASVRPPFALERADEGGAPGFRAGDWPEVLAKTPVGVAFGSFGAGGVSATARWRSTPVAPHAAGMLRLWVAGDLAAGCSGLRLVVRSSTESYVVQPDRAPGLRWKTVNLTQPAGDWWIEAEDTSTTGWFAFTAPVALGRWSWLGNKLLASGPTLAAAGAALLAIASAGACFPRRRTRTAAAAEI